MKWQKIENVILTNWTSDYSQYHSFGPFIDNIQLKGVNKVQLNKDKIIAAFNTGMIRIWNVNTSEIVKIVLDNSSPAISMRANDEILSVGTYNNSIRIYDINKYDLIKIFNVNAGVILSVQLNIDMLVAGCEV